MLFVLLLALPGAGIADFGDFSGGSDYGGSSGSSSWSSSDSWDSSSSGSWDSGGDGTNPVAIIFVILFICYVAFKIRPSIKKGGNRPAKSQRPAGAAPTTGLQPLSALYEWDPGFSAAHMQQRLGNLYVQMQNCWQARDLSPLRGDFTDAQYAQYDRQLQRYREVGQTNMVERIAVLEVDLVGVKQDAAEDILVANIRARITDYVVDDKTGAVVRGSKTAEKFMEYEYTLVRPRGKQTVPEDQDATLNCPNCGAPVNINRSAQCSYCGTIITRADYDWVVSGIRGLSQKTVG